MKLRHLLAVALPLIVFGTAVLPRGGLSLFDSPPPADKPIVPEPRSPLPPPGTPIDGATVEAWTRGGFRLEATGSAEKGELPLLEAARPVGDGDLAPLPEVCVPFALDLSGTEATPEGLRRLAGWKHLSLLKMQPHQLTDDVLGMLADAGVLHTLSPFAVAAEGKHPAHAGEVTVFHLSGSKVTDEGLRHLAGLKNLAYLDLSSTGVKGEGLKHLAPLKRLTTVYFRWSQTTDAIVRGLAEAGLLHAHSATRSIPAGTNRDDWNVRPTGPDDVYALRLGGEPVSDESLRHIASLKNLQILNLERTRVTGAGLKHVAGVERLEKLVLNGCAVGDEDLQHFAGLSRLSSLSLDRTRITGSGLQHITGLKNLTHVHLQALQLDDVAFQHLAKVENLEELTLNGTPLSGRNLKHLARAKKLTLLHMHKTQVTNEVLESLVQTGLLHTLAGEGGFGLLPYFGALGADYLPARTPGGFVHLDLSRTPVTDDGLRHLNGLTHLTSINLLGTKVTDSGIAKLRQELPNCEITR